MGDRTFTWNQGTSARRRIPSERWDMDFTSTRILSGERIQILLIVDPVNRQIPAIHAKAVFTNADVTAALDQLIVAGILPTSITTEWAEGHRKPKPDYPRGSSYSERLTRRLHDECLDLHSFASIEELQAVLEVWRVKYNALSRTEARSSTDEGTQRNGSGGTA